MEADYFGPSQATLCVLCLAHEFELRGSHVHLYNLHGEKSSGLLCVCLFKLSTVGCQMIYFGFLKNMLLLGISFLRILIFWGSDVNISMAYTVLQT